MQCFGVDRRFSCALPTFLRRGCTMLQKRRADRVHQSKGHAGSNRYRWRVALRVPANELRRELLNGHDNCSPEKEQLRLRQADIFFSPMPVRCLSKAGMLRSEEHTSELQS